MTLRTLIVDDEPLAREGIRSLLRGDPDVIVIGESGGGWDAVNKIRELQPDLLFLDVQMRELDGFDIIGEIGCDRFPAIVFVTAYDEYALRAFEVNAIDYVLKPPDPDRFAETLKRVRTRAADPNDLKDQITKAVNDVVSKRAFSGRLMIRDGGRLLFVKYEDVDWIEAAGNYLRLHAGAKQYLVRETMATMVNRLDATSFVRIHRSTIVNVDRIKEIKPRLQGGHAVVLLDGKELPLSRTYKEKLFHELDLSP